MKKILLITFACLLSTTAGAFSFSLPYPFNTWHASAKDFVQHQSEIQSYSVTVKIKRHKKTIHEKHFTAFDYKKIVKHALAYAKQHQTPDLKLVFKPSIRIAKKWDIYYLGHIVTKTVPKQPHHVPAYWLATEKALAERFEVTSSGPIVQHAAPKSYGWYVLAIVLTTLGVFLLGLVLLHFAPRRKV